VSKEKFDTPESELTNILEAGMVFIESVVERKGGEVEQIFVAVTVNGMEPDAATAGHGFSDATDLIAWMLMHAKGAANRVGLNLQIHPLRRG
jgi:hypothetical protein